MKKKRYFKCHKFEHLITEYIMKKQNVSNVTEKDNTELIIKRKKTEKKYKSSSADNTNNLKN